MEDVKQRQLHVRGMNSRQSLVWSRSMSDQDAASVVEDASHVGPSLPTSSAGVHLRGTDAITPASSHFEVPLRGHHGVLQQTVIQW